MRAVKAAQERFGNLIEEELQRIESMKNDHEVTDFSKLDKFIIGILP